MRATTAQKISERSGRPGSPVPPPRPPPKRARPLRSRSYSEVTLDGPPMGERRRRGASPQGPWLPPWLPPPGPSSDGGSEPPLPEPALFEPHGPLLSANSPRMRLPHPVMMFIGREYRESRNEKQWQPADGFLCALSMAHSPDPLTGLPHDERIRSRKVS